jgi:hypothetical protein
LDRLIYVAHGRCARTDRPVRASTSVANSAAGRLA